MHADLFGRGLGVAKSGVLPELVYSGSIGPGKILHDGSILLRYSGNPYNRLHGQMPNGTQGLPLDILHIFTTVQ